LLEKSFIMGPGFGDMSPLHTSRNMTTLWMLDW
jgi:hypothetical protein